MKTRVNGGTTSPTLLRRAADWRDLPAWNELFGRYHPLLNRWCQKLGLDDAETAEVVQRIWIELADRLGSFRYDPSRSFRGWLRSLCRSRVIDFLRSQKRDRHRLAEVAGMLDASPTRLDDDGEADDDSPDDLRESLRIEAEQAQAAVQARVEPRTWNAYWRIAIEGQTIAETAALLGMTYTNAFAAYSRVDRRLRDEGQRRLAVRSARV